VISETKVQMLLKLIESKTITVEDIKNAEYKAEVENRLGQN
jgi:hypothetical protein